MCVGKRVEAREITTFDTLVVLTTFKMMVSRMFPPFSFQFVQVSVGMYALLKVSHRSLEELVICHGYTQNVRLESFQSLHSEDVPIFPKLKRLR